VERRSSSGCDGRSEGRTRECPGFLAWVRVRTQPRGDQRGPTAQLSFCQALLAPTAGGLHGLRCCPSAPDWSAVSNLVVSKSDTTSAPTLRKPEAKVKRIAHVRSSLVGWKPPRIQGIETSVKTAAVPATSFTRDTFDPVTLATGRTRIAVSTFAATSVRLRRAKSTLFQFGPRATSVSERVRGSA
jgi:hypothetical protein